jgi:hypothetical protein
MTKNVHAAVLKVRKTRRPRGNALDQPIRVRFAALPA